ncbi:hypothetical protein RD792_012721 [Penstemon davidsonii]|uniref:Cytochrome P450 n=1 Tax=Penstemon davidsonii TaxID=160366 RepID=A0ABR0CYL9_9LAMI|nr:hypothetical protein RD792_012721 [Penstemon davidsonii]
MDSSKIIWLWISLCLAIVLWFIVFIFTSRKKSASNKLLQPPPGPPGWPLIGNIFDVGMMPHQNTHKLKAKYGPVLWLKLGMSKTLVVQSAKAAEELFKKHDLVFSDRKILDSLTACDFDKGSMTIGRYGEYWRMARKLCSSELFVQKKISASAPTRQTCIDIMLQWIKDDSAASIVNGGGSGEIQFDKYLSLMTFNLLSNYVISRDMIMDSKFEKGNEFYEAMNNLMEWNGIPNLVDSFPFLKWIDPQGIRRNAEKYLGQLMNIIEGFVKERIQEKLSGKEKKTNDFLDALLEYNGKGGTDELSERNVIIIVLEMFLAGSETTSSTIQWGMAELLCNPDLLRKLKDEMDQVIGNSRKVEEGDLNNLPYLQAVVKETMRLHPSLPFLLPRNAMEDTKFMGYLIPKNTMVLVNVWAIHRDPDSWDDPLSFKPERFINLKIDSKGQNFELIPFGSGRRSCIGMFLGDRMVSLSLARLVQNFDWKLPDNVSPECMDMREKMGIALRKLVPLTAIPTERKF